MIRQFFNIKNLSIVLPSLVLGGVFGMHKTVGGVGGFWGELQVVGDEVESYDSLEEMAISADEVVTGRMSDFRLSRVIQGDAPEDVVTYATAEFRVNRRIRGRNKDNTVSVEIMMPQNDPEEAAAVIASRRKSVPNEEFLLFVRDKNDGVYRRLVNSSGLLSKVGGRIKSPLSGHDSDKFSEEFADASTIDEVAGELVEALED